MRHLFFLLFLAQLPLLSNSQTWTKKSVFRDTARYNHTVFTLNDRIYVCGGRDSLGNNFNSLYEYNPTTNAWSSKKAFPGPPRRGLISFSNDTFAFVGLGFDGVTTFQDLYRYDYLLDKWDTMTNYPGQGGRNTMATSLNNYAYVGGGNFNSSGPKNDFWQYDMVNDSWIKKANLGMGVCASGIAFTIDSIIYMGLGNNGSNNLRLLYGYNPNTNVWTQKANFSGQGRMKPACFVINDAAVIGGGFRFGFGRPSTLNDYYEYNPRSNSWTSINVQSFQGNRRADAEAVGLNNKGYIVMGVDSVGSTFNDIWEYANTTVSINEISKVKSIRQLSIFPMPSKGVLNLILEESKNSTFQFQLFNLNGKLVQQSRLIMGEKANTVSLKSLPNGLYIYNLSNKETSYKGKIQLMK